MNKIFFIILLYQLTIATQSAENQELNLIGFDATNDGGNAMFVINSQDVSSKNVSIRGGDGNTGGGGMCMFYNNAKLSIKNYLKINGGIGEYGGGGQGILFNNGNFYNYGTIAIKGGISNICGGGGSATLYNAKHFINEGTIETESGGPNFGYNLQVKNAVGGSGGSIANCNGGIGAKLSIDLNSILQNINSHLSQKTISGGSGGGGASQSTKGSDATYTNGGNGLSNALGGSIGIGGKSNKEQLSSGGGGGFGALFLL